MRTCKENHEFCEDILDELEMCGIFYVDCYEEDLVDDYELTPEEFAISNPWCVDDPLILTKEEMKRLGLKLIEMAN